MKHEVINGERDLTDWNVSKAREASNMRLNDMLENCSDEKSILLAETICAHRMAGLETTMLEGRLSREMSRMIVATKVFFGRTPAEVKYKYQNQNES